jgi:hypothetical protein|tara:strand:- start:4462 stop:4905 length:444 start_codon:yes stop_codon:yes gene_type:complete
MDILNMAVSALVGAIVVWVTRDFIIPKTAGIFLKSAKITKNWQFKDKFDGGVVGQATITQLGNTIKVAAIRTVSRKGEQTNRKFTYKGTIRERNIVMTFEQDDSGGSVCGAIVLRVNSSLNEMKGNTLYYSDSSGVLSYPIYFIATV